MCRSSTSSAKRIRLAKEADPLSCWLHMPKEISLASLSSQDLATKELTRLRSYNSCPSRLAASSGLFANSNLQS